MPNAYRSKFYETYRHEETKERKTERGCCPGRIERKSGRITRKPEKHNGKPGQRKWPGASEDYSRRRATGDQDVVQC
jgi:hypothetical protein